MKPQDESIFKEPSATQQEREQQSRAMGNDPKPDPRRGDAADPAFDDRPRREDEQLSRILNEEHPDELPAKPDDDKKR